MNGRIIGCGHYLPSKIITNDELSLHLDTSDSWIRERTGITQRHIAAQEETTSQMAVEAAKEALSSAGIKAQDLDMIIVATVTPDKLFPSVAALVQGALGASSAAVFDLSAACSGFIYAMSVAAEFLAGGKYKNILVIGAEMFSRIVDWSDRNTCVLFGDGAGAVVLQNNKGRKDQGIIDYLLCADGSYSDILGNSGGAGSTGTIGSFIMKGKEVFKHAVNNLTQVLTTLMEKNKLSSKEINWLVPHQANLRIINAVAQKCNFDDNKIVKTVALHANTSAASIPLALSCAASNFKAGDTIIMEAIGAGLVWGGLLLKW